MTQHDDDPPVPDAGVSPAPVNRHPGVRRQQAVVGAVGVAALLGAGIWLTNAQSADDRQTAIQRDPGVLALAVSASPSVSPSPSGSAAPAAAVSPSGSASASGSAVAATSAPAKSLVKRPAAAKPKPTDSDKVRRKVQAARAAAERDGRPLQRPLTPQAGVASVAAIARTEKTPTGSVRITTAKGDLTGQGDRLMAADRGWAVGRSRCTQTVRFSDNAAARTIPTLLLCWRTSAARSVVTLAVVKAGKASAASTAALIDREWAKLG